MGKINQIRYLIKGSILTQEELYESKEIFHKERAKLPFGEKMKLLAELQEVANGFKNFRERHRR